MQRQARILICDDDNLFHLAVKHALKGKFELKSAYHTDEAAAVIRGNAIDILLLDVQMRTPDEGLRFIPKARELNPDLDIVMASGRTDFGTVREAMTRGATDFVPKDFDVHELGLTLDRVLERRRLIVRKEQIQSEAVRNQSEHVMIGESARIKALRRTIEKIRASAVNVVITGETGTGKEVVARQIRGTLPDGSLAPFVAVDSSTIQSTMAESRLFGHEKGAFTGAERVAKGLFEEADGGIIYFDEIGNMPLDIQAKLLRVLQEKEVMRLGSTRPIPLDFRVVCATNRDLEQQVKAGQFKDDLLQRLNVIPIELPPLRERKEDIPLLIAHFSERNAAKRRLRFTEEAVSLLQAYSWPGNIRELVNVVAYVATMADSDEIDVADLPPKFRDRAKPVPAVAPAGPDAGTTSGSFYEQVAAFEKRILASAYDGASGNISKLAISLGMDRSHLYSKLKEYGIHAARSR